MQATDVLTHEHRTIELVLDALDRLAAEVEAGRPLDREQAGRALEIVREFADKCHHGKEEQHLFVRMAEKGLPRDAGPLGVMLHEHGEGRRHVRAMGEAMEGEGAEADREFAAHARAYTSLLRGHIHREDHVLFPMAAQLFNAEEDARLVEAFEEVEREEIGEGRHEQYHTWAHELAEGRKAA